MKKNLNLFVEMFGNPDIQVREVLPDDDIETVKDKNRKPFQAQKVAILKVTYGEKTYYISNKTGYCYDGATIPFKIGKGNMKLLIPALWHDIICEDKTLVDYNRKLSSMIFRELLLQCKVNKLTANIMYEAVDLYQHFIQGWNKK